MAQFILQGRLKLLLNSENSAQCKLIGEQAYYFPIELVVFMSVYTGCKPLLNTGFQPVNVVCWKRAICLEFTEKADVLEYYDQTVNSPNGSFNIPAVLRVMKRKKVRNILSRKNIFYRDDYMCQYCKVTNNLTIDHVVPIARGGKWEWENLVTACIRCNSKKGHKTLEEANMNLVKAPKAPKDYDILAIPLTSATVRMLKIKKGTPQEWRQYLPK
uniref:HNH nuclease domain-containing protein n=1 Tax=Chenopodium quinoa TaxID=63459 RepID=A0A803MN23_CHEQI